jgi:hypothetical protein
MRAIKLALVMFFSIAVLSCGGGGGGAPSAQASIPATPTGITAVAADGQVTLSWNAVSGATSYNLYMASVTGVTKSNYTTLAAGMQHTGVTSPYTHTSLTNGTPYYFVVTAVNSAGESAESAQVSATPAVPIAPPAAPTGVTATAGDGFVSLNWNASAGATSYKISRQNNGPFTTIATGVVALNYTDNTVTNGTTYVYAVRAVNAAGESLDTNSSGANPTPTSCVALATGLTFQNMPSGASTGFSLSAIVADTDRIYWFDYDASLGYSGGAIRSVPKIGGAVTVVASGLGGVNAFTVDANNVYWTEYDIASGDGSVKQVPKAGGTIITLATDFFPTGIAVDATTVFYSGGAGPSGGTKSVPIGGGTVTNISVGTGSFGAASLVQDANYIYGVAGTLARRILKTGGTVEVLATGLQNASGAALDNSSLYWAELGAPGKIGKTPKAGGGATYLATGLNLPHNVAIDSNFAYFDPGAPGNNPDPGYGLAKVPLAGGTVVGANESGCRGQYVTVDGTHLYTSVFGNEVAGAGKILRSGK